jgi:uncharacterized membrane protein
MNYPELIRSHEVELSCINGRFSDSAIEVRPNQSLNHASFLKIRNVFVGISALIAGYSFIQGNLFAPFFALVNIIILMLIFEQVWKGQDFEERLDLADGKILVECRNGKVKRSAQFDPLWVRFEADPLKKCSGLLISDGIQFRLGGFLNPEQRKLLTKRITHFLDHARESALARAQAHPLELHEQASRI